MRRETQEIDENMRRVKLRIKYSGEEMKREREGERKCCVCVLLKCE